MSGKSIVKIPEGTKYFLLYCKFVLYGSLNLCAVKACKLLSKFLNKCFYIYFRSLKWTACFINVHLLHEIQVSDNCVKI